MTMTGLPLAVVFFLFFFLFLIHFQQPIHIGLCRQSSRISSRERRYSA